MENGFPENTVERILRENPKNNRIEMVNNGSEGIETAASFDYSKSFQAPYNPRASALFKILQKRFGITPIFKKTTTLGNLLKHSCKPITSDLEKRNSIYEIPCQNNCSMTYVGQSKRKLIVRLKEHERGCRNAEKKVSKKI